MSQESPPEHSAASRSASIGPSAEAITIRRLRPSDSIQELTHLLHKAYAKQTEIGLHALASHQSPEVTRKRVSKGECFVAELGGRVVGTIMFQEPSWGGGGGAPESGPRWFRRHDVANFSQFAVEPSMQGRGIGHALLRRIEERARELGMNELALSTAEPDAQLVAFYRRCGFREIERFDWGVTNYTSIIMSKALARDEPGTSGERGAEA